MQFWCVSLNFSLQITFYAHKGLFILATKVAFASLGCLDTFGSGTNRKWSSFGGHRQPQLPSRTNDQPEHRYCWQSQHQSSAWIRFQCPRCIMSRVEWWGCSHFPSKSVPHVPPKLYREPSYSLVIRVGPPWCTVGSISCTKSSSIKRCETRMQSRPFWMGWQHKVGRATISVMDKNNTWWC